MILFLSNDDSMKYFSLSQLGEQVESALPGPGVYDYKNVDVDFVFMDKDLPSTEKRIYTDYFYSINVPVILICYCFENKDYAGVFKAGFTYAFSDIDGVDVLRDILNKISADRTRQALVLNKIDNYSDFKSSFVKNWFSEFSDIIYVNYTSCSDAPVFYFSDSCISKSGGMYFWIIRLEDCLSDSLLWYYQSEKLKKHFSGKKKGLGTTEICKLKDYFHCDNCNFAIYYVDSKNSPVEFYKTSDFLNEYSFDGENLAIIQSGGGTQYSGTIAPIGDNILLFNQKELESDASILSEQLVDMLSDDMESLFTVPYRAKQVFSENNKSLSFFSILSVDKSYENDAFTRVFIIEPLIDDVVKTSEELESIVNSVSGDLRLSYYTRIVTHEYILNVNTHGDNHNRVVVEIKIGSGKVALTFWDEGLEWVPAEGGTLCWNDPDDVYASGGRGTKIIDSLSSLFIRKRIGRINETFIILPRDDLQENF